MENYKTIAIMLAIGFFAVFVLCIVLFVLVYRAMKDNATLQYQIASITSDNSQEMTFKTIDDDLRKIIKLLENKHCLSNKTTKLQTQ